MRYLISSIAALALLLFAAPAIAQVMNRREVLMTTEEVATGTPVIKYITNNLGSNSAYLHVKTENETADASLVVAVYANETLGSTLLCTSTAITTNTSTHMLLGSLAAAGEGITDACDFPLTRSLTFIFTTSGAGADFDVSAALHWLAH